MRRWEYLSRGWIDRAITVKDPSCGTAGSNARSPSTWMYVRIHVVCIARPRFITVIGSRPDRPDVDSRSAKLIFQGLNLGRALPASGESVVDPDPGRDRQHYADDKIIRPLQLRYLVASLALLPLKSNRSVFLLSPFLFLL